MNQILKTKIFAWTFTAIIIVPLVITTVIGTCWAYCDVAFWKISRLVTNKFWYGRTLAQRKQNNSYWALPQWMLDVRTRNVKDFHRGYELQIRL
jgi:phosphate/sulfate permease